MPETATPPPASVDPTANAGPTAAKADESAEFVVNKQDLLDEITQLQGAIDRKSTIPILNNILVHAAGQVLQLTATDLDISIRTSCLAKVGKPGAFTIPARKLYDYLRLLPNAEINVKVLANSWLQLRSGRSHTKMVGLPRTNFPSLPLFPTDGSLKLESDVLRNLISQTVFAISKEESRYTLNGALLTLKAQSIAMVTTDGHRLALLEHTKAQTVTQESKILIPRKALLEMNSLLATFSGEYIQFAENDSTLFFVIGKRLLTTRRLVGTFPNYEAVLPRDHNNAVVIGRDELCSAILRVAQFSDERSNAIRLRFEKNELKLYCSRAEAGESEDLIPINYTGEPVVMGFNSHYLLDFLKVVDAEKVRLAFKDPHTASELRPQDPALGEYTYRYVVMPVRI